MIQAVPGATDLPVSGHAASAVGRSRRYSGMTASQRWGSRGTYVRGTSVEDPIAAKPNRARRVIALVARPVGQVLRRAESLGSTPAQSEKIILLSWSAAGTRGDAATTLPTPLHTVGAARARIRHAGHA